jgi:N-acetylglucosaminyldiphosphoundecaprenol N-acetyl-beta-D-mannosaminyltransferase
MTTATSSALGAPRFEPEKRIWIADIPVDVLSEAEIMALVDRSVQQEDRVVLANVNLHGLYTTLQTPPVMTMLNEPDTVVHIDGAPIVWMARLLGADLPERARHGHIDMLPKLLRRCAAAGWRVAIIGSDVEGAQENERTLEGIAPGLQVRGFSGYFDMADLKPDSVQSKMIEAVREFRPALLLVGMGMPRQELWIARNRRILDVPVIMPVGGFADYFAGRTRTAPRFLGPLGLEWLFRLACDPRRLGFRYLVEPLLLLGLLVRSTTKGARWGRDDRFGRGGTLR